MQNKSNLVGIRVSDATLSQLQQLVPVLRRKTGANCNLSSLIRQCVTLCLDKHRDEIIADLKEAA